MTKTSGPGGAVGILLPPLALDEPRPAAGERLLRWGTVGLLHLGLLYGALHVSVKHDLVPLPPSIAVRLLPQAEVRKAPPPPPPKPAPAVPKAAAPVQTPPRPQPVLAARAPEAPASFAVAPQPPAPPVPAPVAVATPPAPPAPAAAPAVTGPRFDADYLHNPKPVYPAFSRRNGEEGKVFLRVKVSADGSALELEIKQSSGFPRLDGAARDAVAKWRFIPARRGDEAIESWVTVPVVFALE